MKFESTGWLNGPCIIFALVWPNIITVSILTASFLFAVHCCCRDYEEKLNNAKKGEDK